MVQARGAPTAGDEKAHKHPRSGHNSFGAPDPTLPRMVEHESAEGRGGKLLRLLPKGVEQRADGQTIPV
jgi:hypothetical protein